VCHALAGASFRRQRGNVPRPPRIDTPGRYWHVFPRGNNDDAIVHDALDLIAL